MLENILRSVPRKRSFLPPAIAAIVVVLAIAAPVASADTTVAMSVRGGVQGTDGSPDNGAVWYTGSTSPQVDIGIDGLPDGGSVSCIMEGGDFGKQDVPCGTPSEGPCAHEECLVFQAPRALQDGTTYFLFVDEWTADGDFAGPEQQLTFSVQTEAPAADVVGPGGSPRRPVFDLDAAQYTGDVPFAFECSLHPRGTPPDYAHCGAAFRAQRVPLDHRIYELDVRTRDALGHVGPVYELAWSPYPCTFRLVGRVTPREFATGGLPVSVNCALTVTTAPLLADVFASVSAKQAAALGSVEFGQTVGRRRVSTSRQVSTQIVRVRCRVLCGAMRRARQLTLQIQVDPAIGDYEVLYVRHIVLVA